MEKFGKLDIRIRKPKGYYYGVLYPALGRYLSVIVPDATTKHEAFKQFKKFVLGTFDEYEKKHF
jgi:hypothetical protein